ncbi:hypothetical protein BBP40_008319 [Aspergillus hancockii]|nr:hypothetical protein BBP40_008319 [Aspergillus hancockii]
MNPSDETAPPQINDARPHDAPRNDSTSESSLTRVTNSIANVAESSMNEVKNKLTTVVSNESVQSVWEQVRSMAPDRNEGENQEIDTSPNQDEIDLIDNMEKEKIAEFLREKNKSDARRPKNKIGLMSH